MILDSVRYPARSAAFLGVTLSYYAVLEAQTAMTPPKERAALLERYKRHWGQVILSLYGIDVITEGPHLARGVVCPGVDDRGKGRIFIMNHRSGMDILLCIALLEAQLVSRADLAKWPLIGFLAKRLGTLFVDRSSRKSGARVLQMMAQAVEDGQGIVIYPEGTTFDGDEVRPFHAGAFSTARRTDAEIVPIGIAYGEGGAAFGDETFLAHMKRVSAVPATKVAMVVGEPIRVDGRETPELSAACREVVQGLVDRGRTLVSPAPGKTP